MAGWTTYEGKASLLPIANVDTDQLIPARFMSVPRKDGYGDYLLYDMRRAADGTLRADFVLNRHKDTGILIAGPNFGSGSSREAAVYALIDAGVRVVIATAFGDIFASNAVNNGLLPAKVSDAGAETLQRLIGEAPRTLKVDLERGVISTQTQSIPFDLQDSWRTKLMNGWDDIDLTLQHAQAIESYKDDRRTTAPWAWPAGVA
ncbi:3-isopropylmalate dehydratase, small subunit [Sulfitobacter noctilucicola]|uniref:3-isopropylmalate dehydratase n=1 Tax=Sulfitobacter noctilucicola TaxID=1342301 RepID=A0A7W6M9U1_9RHOB|nr:3-isopropylmalate dehydratase small subunit [Sulfitobacter noctilucicola]KIN63470.1 3-isopropylmalate dehydratase, small subunit [Sulfitobacter noctilucicola]MBB4175019.1 3-isopropylmalate/(R)-2-methylmalate dehydratase small subunit [Sulfitobacter noctilucicola]